MEEARNRKGQTLEEFLAAYDVSQYERPSVAADVALFTMVECEDAMDLAVVLIRRADHPFLGGYALPGGFVNMDEDTLCAANRELREETGIKNVLLRRFGVYDKVDRDPRTRILTVGHYGVAPLGSVRPRGGDDAADASLFAVEVEMQAQSAPAETYRISLYGKKLLSAPAQLRYDPMGAYSAFVPGGDLISDHSQELFDALRALSAQPRERMARLFTLTCPRKQKRAAAALDKALSALPKA